MSDMNPYLAAMYNTNGAAEIVTEDMQKTANMELFCKLAADNGLDLSQMTDDQIAGVYAQVFPEDLAKIAEDEKKEHEEEESKEKEKKEEAAAQYHEEKKAFVEKCAEADYMGRIMAHAFTQEKEQIEFAKEGAPKNVDFSTGQKVVNKLKEYAKAPGEALKYHKMKGKLEKSLEIAKHTAKGEDVTRLEKGIETARRLRSVHGKKALVTGGAAAAAAGGAGAGIHHAVKSKEGSAEAFDEIAANHAIKVAEAAGWDAEEAVERISAVHTLGLGESEKVAYVSDVESATHVRALEYLETAGYPVNWEEVFGS